MSKVKSIIKAAKVIEELAYKEAPISLTTLSKEVSIPPSTLHRILSSLKAVNFVKQNSDGKYLPGSSLNMLSYALLQQEDLRELAMPYLETLKEETNESANLVVLSSDYKEVIYIAQAESDATVRGFSYIGSRAPSYATAVGKVMLADADWAEVSSALQESGMRALTGSTITELDTLEGELEEIRNKGFAVDREETERGAACIAAPLYGPDNEVEAAISISGPSNRILGDSFSEMTRIAKRIANELSQEFKLNYQ